MNVSVNGKRFTVSDFGGVQEAIVEYTVSEDLLPSYARVTSETDTSATVVFIKNEFPERLNDFDEQSLKKLSREYPNLEEITIVLEYIRQNPDDRYGPSEYISRKYPNLVQNLSDYSTDEDGSKIKEYSDNLATDIAVLRKSVEKSQEQQTILDQLTPVESTNVVLEASESTIELDLPNDDSLVDVFDAFQTSGEIPFVHLHLGEREFYKVYPDVKIREWNSDEYSDGVHFKVLTRELGTASKRSRLSTFYSSGVWTSDNKIELAVSIDSDITAEDVKNVVFDSIKDRVEYTVVDSRESSFRASFFVEIDSFNTAVFSDLIANDPFMSYYLSLNEQNGSATEKTRYVIYFGPPGVPPLTISLTIEPSGITFRTNKSKTLEQFERARSVLIKLMSYYLEQKQRVIEEYSKYVKPKSFAKYERIKGGSTQNMKTGQRLLALQKQLPDVFSGGYASVCSQEFQPYIVTEKEAAALKKKFKKAGGKNVDKLILEFEGKLFACYDPSLEREHIWPRMKNNTKGSEKYPQVPCCYITMGKGPAKTKKIKYNPRDITHIFSPPKKAEPGRYGELPINMAFVSDGVDGRVLRYGIKNDPQSIFYCLEYAFNDDFLKNPSQMQQKVVEVKEKMIDSNMNLTKQETYAIDTDNLKMMLESDTDFIDPRLFLRLLEKTYETNIYLFSSEDNGKYIIPDAKYAYLPSAKIYDRSVVINMFPMARGYEYYCELVVIYDDDQITKVHSNSPFERKIKEVSAEVNKIYVLAPEAIFPYTNKSSFAPISQYIDNNGKCRMINFDKGSVVVPPMAPFDLKISSILVTMKKDDALALAVKNEWKLEMQDVRNKKVIGFWFSVNSVNGYFYIPVKKTSPIKKIPASPSYLPDPIRSFSRSRLENMNNARRLAEILKQYTLFEASHRVSDEDTTEMFVVKKGHSYDIKKIGKKLERGGQMYSNGKLIVHSESMRKRLAYFLKRYEINDYQDLLRYKDRKLMKDFYRTLSDFRENKNQLVFLSLDSIEDWAKYEKKDFCIQSYFEERSRLPYFYRNFSINNNEICIVQHVIDGDLKRACAVSEKWETDRINTGFRTPPTDDGKCTIYGIGGGVVGEGPPVVELYENYYAALLFVNRDGR